MIYGTIGLMGEFCFTKYVLAVFKYTDNIEFTYNLMYIIVSIYEKC